MNIESYPIFRPIELNDKHIFDEAFRENPPEISEFTFTNLYSWRGAYDLNVSMLGGLLILRSYKNGSVAFFPPIGRGDIKGVMTKVLKDTNAVFMRVPERCKGLLETDKVLMVDPDPDNSDYIYKVKDLVLLSGKKYDGKRNLIKKFKSGHEYDYTALDAGNAAECLEFEEIWCSIKNCDIVEGLSNERRAIKDMVSNFSVFGLIGGAIRISAKTCAVAIAERLNTNTLVMHILKADPDIAGLYQTIMQEFLSHNPDFEYVNLEQDLGIDGLRKSKLSYHPSGMIRKFLVRLA